MTSLGLFALLLCLSSLFGIVNRRTLRLPTTIGILVIALFVSFVLMGVDALTPGHDLQALPRAVLRQADLPGNLLEGALSFLLFAGALQVDLDQLMARMGAVLFLALLGTLLAVGLFGGAMYGVFLLLGLKVSPLWCVVLGAILAPTDPVSVVGMLRRLGLPGPMQAVFAGESLFNDGVGVVVFGVAMMLATQMGATQTGATQAGVAQVGAGGFGLWEAARAFGIEAVGGGVLGFVSGWVALRCALLVEDAHLELLVSLSLATGTFSLANALGLSGPIAVVVAGLWLGSSAARRAVGPAGRAMLVTFWNLVDEILNALLFLLIGFEVLVALPRQAALAALLAGIPLSVLARGLSVALALLPVRLDPAERRRALAVLTWGGLRGGISVSLALDLPEGPMKHVLAPVCYGIVIFTIVVQGLTIERVVRRFYGAPAMRMPAGG